MNSVFFNLFVNKCLSNLLYDREEHPDRPEVGVEGDVCFPRDDRNALQAGQGDRQGYAYVGSNPQQTLQRVG